MTLTDAIEATARRVEVRLNEATASLDNEAAVTRAMRYALEGGKRLRALLVMESARLHGVGADQAVQAAAAVEALHAYSLVHDDLPAMDDDALRRGRPTLHVKWDEATAILAGDALQSLAFELLADPRCASDPAIRVELIAELARAAGARGMVLGQARDIAAEKAAAPLTLDQITELQAGKTGALFGWSACAGARLAGAAIGPLAAYARALGLAFQITDDLLDVEGDAARLGKGVGKDAGAGKATFVSLLGAEGARTRARELAEEAEAALAPYGTKGETLRQVARFAICRDM